MKKAKDPIIDSNLSPALILLLALMDILFTHYFIALCGNNFDLELNPLMRYVMTEHGWFYAYTLRLVLPAIMVPMLWWYSKRGEAIARVGYHIAFWSHVGVNLWHCYNLWQVKDFVYF